MGNLKKGWYVCESNFIQWRKNYRIWMIAAIETILIFRYLHGLSEYGQATGKTITSNKSINLLRLCYAIL